MCLYSAFRQQVRTTFPTLACSVMMYEKGSGVGGELTMFRAKVQGQPVATDAVTAREAVSGLAAQVKSTQVVEAAAEPGSTGGECLYSTFRQQVREAFATLICSVMMYEKRNEDGSWRTVYRASVQGQPIGAAVFTEEAPTAAKVIKKLIAKVGPARRAVKAAREQRLVARFAELVPLSGGVSRQLVVSRGGVDLALAA